MLLAHSLAAAAHIRTHVEQREQQHITAAASYLNKEQQSDQYSASKL
jgi:hypothetical protein